MKRTLASLLGLCLPACALKNMILRALGWHIGAGCRIGFSWIRAESVMLGERVSIGHGNYLDCKCLVMRPAAYIQHFNLVKGDIWVFLLPNAALGNMNKVYRARRGVTWGRAVLRLGVYSKITSKHIVDCTRSVRFGDYSTLAGSGSQIWTHGYMHAPSGLDRFRVDGSVRIGDNVYIGSMTVVNAAVSISDGVTVGAASCVSKSLLKPGLYVAQPLRWIALDYEQAMVRHPKVEVRGLVERVYNKKPGI
ncbi:hypothetical protein LOY37_19820 [Pseudomonas sp. B21-012]|uniref:acyltransferase n=1 Tax=unclassified Pseudomonas TaxID=196821 RepID=UPI0021601E7D|nr:MULTISPECIES: hypothetical protein [unclassified Pseudomonas]UVL60300.1 hypothetical protein LOY54_20035 [Pseudomonas sp. B21-032]UVM54577.1 hypothetical protein LOY37_19820 [Pseudomonas sp. B21-012]